MLLAPSAERLRFVCDKMLRAAGNRDWVTAKAIVIDLTQVKFSLFHCCLSKSIVCFFGDDFSIEWTMALIRMSHVESLICMRSSDIWVGNPVGTQNGRTFRYHCVDRWMENFLLGQNLPTCAIRNAHEVCLHGNRCDQVLLFLHMCVCPFVSIE